LIINVPDEDYSRIRTKLDIYNFINSEIHLIIKD
jgi:hypothetical protein